MSEMRLAELEAEMTEWFISGAYLKSLAYNGYRELAGQESCVDYGYGGNIEYDDTAHPSRIALFHVEGSPRKSIPIIDRFVGNDTEILAIAGKLYEANDRWLVPVILMRKYLRTSDVAISGFIMQRSSTILLQEALGQYYYRRICFDSGKLPFFKETDLMITKNQHADSITYIPAPMPEDF